MLLVFRISFWVDILSICVHRLSANKIKNTRDHLLLMSWDNYGLGLDFLGRSIGHSHSNPIEKMCLSIGMPNFIHSWQLSRCSCPFPLVFSCMSSLNFPFHQNRFSIQLLLCIYELVCVCERVIGSCYECMKLGRWENINRIYLKWYHWCDFYYFSSMFWIHYRHFSNALIVKLGFGLFSLFFDN